MNREVRRYLVFTIGLLLTAGGMALAAPPKETTISIAGLHCAGCAKKVSAKLTAVSGVAKAKADVETKTVTVTPKAGTLPSPKALWEAVEKAGEKPTKLEGPSGTFTSRPKS